MVFVLPSVLFLNTEATFRILPTPPRLPRRSFSRRANQRAEGIGVSDKNDASRPFAESWPLQTRQSVTDAIVEGFSSSSSDCPVDSIDNGNPESQKPNLNQEKGKQRQVVEHLLSGELNEDLLLSMPITTLNWSIKTLGKNNRIDLAELLFHWMRARKVANEHTFVKLCEACEAKRDVARAIRAWRMIRRIPSTGIALRERATAALLKTFRPQGDVRGAQRILNEVLRSPKSASYVNEYCFNIVIRIAADVGDVATAFQVAELLRAHPTARSDVRTASGLLSAIESSKRWSRVPVVHRMIVEDGILADLALYCQLISGYAAAGRPGAAEALLDEMYDRGLRPNRRHWNSLLYAHAEAGRYEDSLRAFDRMTGKLAGMRPDSYTIVALCHAASNARAGHAASRWIHSVMVQHDVPINDFVACALIKCCRHPVPGRDAHEALRFVQSVLRMLQISGISPSIETMNAIMVVQDDAEDYRGLEQTLQLIEANPETIPKDATWDIAMKAFEKAGWFDKAEGVERLRETWKTLHSD
jgi:pentatricopeptide repeat protein